MYVIKCRVCWSFVSAFQPTISFYAWTLIPFGYLSFHLVDDRMGEFYQRRNHMKQYRIMLALTVLVLASLACQTLTGSRDDGPQAPVSTEPAGDQTEPTTAPTNSNDSEGGNVTVDTDFPMTEDAFNVTEVGGSLIYYTKISQEDLMDFYRDAYTAKGYTERELLTVVSETTFSMVFDGDPSGKAVVIQSVDLGDGSRTVSVRLEDV
jgi:hypothetical protein